MTCKDCIHYEICKDDCESGYLFESENGDFCDDDCEHFKNKADFVEVVRCANCKHLVVYDNWCTYFGHKKSDDDFCSYGKRK